MAKTTITIEDVIEDGQSAVKMLVDYGDLSPDEEPTMSAILGAGIVLLFESDTLFPMAEEQVRQTIFEKDVRPLQIVPAEKDAA